MPRPKSKYREVWNTIKSKGKVSLALQTANTGSIELKQSLVKKITKAIIKEKYIDVEFRRLHPYATLSFDLHQETQILEISLIDYYSLDVN